MRQPPSFASSPWVVLGKPLLPQAFPSTKRSSGVPSANSSEVSLTSFTRPSRSRIRKASNPFKQTRWHHWNSESQPSINPLLTSHVTIEPLSGSPIQYTASTTTPTSYTRSTRSHSSTSKPTSHLGRHSSGIYGASTTSTTSSPFGWKYWTLL